MLVISTILVASKYREYEPNEIKISKPKEPCLGNADEFFYRGGKKKGCGISL